MQLLVCIRPRSPCPHLCSRDVSVLFTVFSPGLTELWCSPGFLGLLRPLFLGFLADPLCTFLPRHCPGYMLLGFSPGVTALCWLPWPSGKGLFYSPQSLSKRSQSQHGASSFFPQQFPNSGYQPQDEPPELLIRKVLRNVLKERMGGKKNSVGTQVVHSFINF